MLWAATRVNGCAKNSQYGRARLGAGPEWDVCQVQCDSCSVEHGQRVYRLSWQPEGHDGSNGSDGEVLGTHLSCQQTWVKDVSHVAMAAIVAMEMTM